MRLPASKSKVPKSPGTPLYFVSPTSMTPTPKWQEKLKLKSKLKSEWKASPPVFEKQGLSSGKRWSIKDDDIDTEATDSIYGSKSDLEFSDNEDQVAKIVYDKAKSETKRALLKANTRNSETSAHRFHRGGSQRGSFFVEGLECSIHDSTTSIDYIPSEDDLAAYVYQKARAGDEKTNSSTSNKNITPGHRGSVRSRKSLFEKALKEEAKQENGEESKEEERQTPVYRREGSLRSFYDEADADITSFHGSKTQIEYVPDEDDIAQYVYQKAQRTAERLGGKPKLEKQMSGYNFCDLLFENEKEP